MEYVGAHSFREKLSKIQGELSFLSKNTSVLDQTITISRRKNALLSKDVQDLRRRKEEQSAVINREENKIFSLAREVSANEDRVNQMEVELEELTTAKNQIEKEIEIREEGVKEYELILGLYEGCAVYW